MKALIGILAGVAIHYLGYPRIALVVWAVAILIGAISIFSAAGRRRITDAFTRLGYVLGRFLAIVLLVPIFLIGFPIARLYGWLSGSDPLQLRNSHAPSYWLAADADSRKVRWVKAQFVTERLSASGAGWAAMLATLAGLLVLAEVVLRLLSFGNPMLYQTDAQFGYFPAPNQRVHRYGGLVQTNSLGMRAPERPVQKPKGTLRILMLGDSTLFGGSYIDQPNLYARRLDTALDASAAKDDVQVWNAGANGWGPFNKIGYVERLGTFDADIAIIAMPFADIYRPLTQFVGVPYFAADAPPRLALEELIVHLNWRSRYAYRARPSAAETARQRHDGLEAYRRLAQLLIARGCEVHFEVLPSIEAGTDGDMSASDRADLDDLTAALAPLGVSVGHPVGVFKGKGARALLYRPDGHLETAGHLHYADYLKTRMMERSLKLREHVRLRNRD